MAPCLLPARPRAAAKPRRAFTLIELLVVISIIALLIGILLPVLGSARHSARSMVCLSNIRQLEMAHFSYLQDNRYRLIEANLSHGGITHGSHEPWFETLARDYLGVRDADGFGDATRSPLDDSPHWGPSPDGAPIPGAPAAQRRVTSYGINEFLDATIVPWGPAGPASPAPFRGYAYDQVPRPSQTVHFHLMATTGDFAGADHAHVSGWFTHPKPSFRARQQAGVGMVSGNPGGRHDGTWGNDHVSNYSFLDGHAAALTFSEVLTDVDENLFDPRSAR